MPAPVIGVPVLAGSKQAAFKITESTFVSPVTGSVKMSLIPSCRNPTIGKGPPGIDGRLKTGTVTTESLRLMLLTCRKAGLGLLAPPVMVVPRKKSCPVFPGPMPLA